MKKGIILLSGTGKLAEAIIDKNRYGQDECVDFIIACSDKTRLNEIYRLHLGCYIHYVPNFSAVEHLLRKNEIELIVFSGYLGVLPEALRRELNKKFPVFYFNENGSSLYEPGYRGEALVNRIKYFNSESSFDNMKK